MASAKPTMNSTRSKNAPSDEEIDVGVVRGPAAFEAERARVKDRTREASVRLARG